MSAVAKTVGTVAGVAAAGLIALSTAGIGGAALLKAASMAGAIGAPAGRVSNIRSRRP